MKWQTHHREQNDTRNKHMNSFFQQWLNSKIIIIIKGSEFVSTEINECIAEPLNCKNIEASVSVERLKKKIKKEKENFDLDMPEMFHCT